MANIIRGISKNARFWVIDSTNIIQKAQEIHNMSPTAIAAFGRLLTAGTMMGTNLKGDDLLTLRIDSEGPLRQMLVTSGSHGNVKGYVANPQADIALKENGQPDVGNLVGPGMLRVIKDMGFTNSEPYVGLSNLQTGEIAEDLAYYYYTSEQTPTVIGLGVSLNSDLSIKKSGGFMIQLMPNAEESFIAKLEEKIKAIRPVTELLEGGMDPDRIAKLLYEDMEVEDGDALVESYEILERNNVEYMCDCNKDKFFRGVVTLGEKEINSILEKDSKVEVECHFCRTKYSFEKKDFNLVFNSN